MVKEEDLYYSDEIKYVLPFQTSYEEVHTTSTEDKVREIYIIKNIIHDHIKNVNLLANLFSFYPLNASTLLRQHNNNLYQRRI